MAEWYAFPEKSWLISFWHFHLQKLPLGSSKCSFQGLWWWPYRNSSLHCANGWFSQSQSRRFAAHSFGNGIVAYAHKNYRAGEQVWVSYGGKSNAELLSQYGFVDPDNGQEAVYLRLGEHLLVNSAQLEVIGKLLEDPDPASAIFRVSRKPREWEPKLMPVLRVLAKDEIPKDAEDMIPRQEPELEASAYEVLQEALKIRGSEYPFSLEEDKQQLEKLEKEPPADAIGDRLTLALKLRISEQELLELVSAYANEQALRARDTKAWEGWSWNQDWSCSVFEFKKNSKEFKRWVILDSITACPTDLLSNPWLTGINRCFTIYLLYLFIFYLYSNIKKDKHFHHSPVVRVIACWMVLGKSGLFSVDMCHSTKLLTPQASFKSQLSIFISKFRHSWRLALSAIALTSSILWSSLSRWSRTCD